MARLASGVAVITARRPDGQPCGLVATSVSSFSANPPSALVSVAHTSRCHSALAEGNAFGVHILAAGRGGRAAIFAGLRGGKFSRAPSGWGGGGPPSQGGPSYPRRRRGAPL